MSPNAPALDLLGHLAEESARFAEALDQAPHGATVPSCPGWNAADLLWHLGEVQWFWGTVVREGLTRDQAEALKPERPADWSDVRQFYATASRDLGEVLAATAPEAAAWTWSSDQTV